MNTRHFHAIAPAGLLLGGIAGTISAAEVPCPSNLFPSPTGIYRNESADNVIYGTTVQLAATECREFNRSVTPPTGTTPQTVTCGVTSHFRVGGGTGTPPVWAVVPVDVVLSLSPNAMGVPGGYDIEVLAFSAAGLPGGLMIRESPSLPSRGQHAIHRVPSGNWYADSFFDVFTEVSADGGATWIPGNAAMHFDLTEPELLVTAENQLPPPRTILGSASTISFSGGVRVAGLQLTVPVSTIKQPPTRGALYQTDESGNASGLISLDGGATFTNFDCNYAIKRRTHWSNTLTSTYDAACEIVLLELSGGTLPAGMRLRESPTKASTGRASSRLATDGLYRISSFFDVFTELSLNNGATWTPNDGPPCYIVNSHATPGVDVAAFGFTPQEVTSTRAMPSPHILPLMSHFENGDIPTQEDLIEYPDGTIIRGLDLRLPSSAVMAPAPGTPPQTQNFDITMQCEVSADGGVTYEPVRGTAAASVRINAVAVGAGASAKLYDMEWLALDFSSTLGSGATLRLRESPTKASTGKTSIRPAADGSHMVGSFFDIFTEVSLDNGVTWTAGQKQWCFGVRVTDNTPEAIRPAAIYPPADTPLLADGDISASNGVVVRRIRVHAIHNGSPLPPSGGSATYPFTTTASGEISTDGGVTFTAWSGDCSGNIGLSNFLDSDSDGDGVSECRFFNAELLSLDLSGGGLGSVRLRESPTKASLGRTSVRTTPNNSFGTLAFFDVFTEISADNGATWAPASGLPVTFAFSDSPGEHFYPTASLPPAAALESPPDDVVDLGSGRRLRKTRTHLDMNDQDRHFAPPAEGESVQLHLNGTMDCEYSTDNGATYSPVRTAVACEVTATTRRRAKQKEAEANAFTSTSTERSKRSEAELSLECTALNFELPGGGTVVSIRESPTEPSRGGMRLRESPSLPSRNQTQTRLRESPTRSSLREAAGGYMLEGFFDVFIETGETTSDGFLVWSPRSNVMRLGFQPVADQDNCFATDAFPPRDGVLETNAYEPPACYGGGLLVSDIVLGGFASSAQQPGPPTRTVTCSLGCQVSTDGGTTWSPVSGTGDITFRSTPLGTTGAVDHELLGLNFVLPGGMMVRESPSKASLGRTSIRTRNPEPTANNYLIDSFFDVFTEISMDGGATWLPAENACRLNAHRVSLEVACNTDWQPTPNQRIVGDPDFDLLFDDTDVSISGVTLDPISITPGTAPSPSAGATLKRQCLFNMGLKGRMAAGSTPESHRMQVELGWECSEVSSSADGRVLLNEITSMNVCGGTLPTGMMIRESPTRASLGRTSVRTVPGGYQISSFFDIFIELSLDGGQTWHAARAPLCLELADASAEHVFPPSSDPLPAKATWFVQGPRGTVSRCFQTGDKPTQAQFHSLIDSSLNIVDDRQLIGLRHYDASIEYQVGDTAVVNRGRTQITFGYVLWKDADSNKSREAYDMEVTAFDMQGGTLPAGMRLRESPTLPSKGRCTRVPQADGTYRISSFFDVFVEVSHDNGGTWDACDLPLHFVQQDRTLPALSHSDQFIPQGISYVQRGTPVRCGDGTCAAGACMFTATPAPLPTVPGSTQLFTGLAGHFAATFTRNGGSATAVSADVLADVSATLVETVDGTRYFDTEMLKLNLTGTPSPAEFRLRESPTKASLGRHTVTDAGGGNFRISSFFDIWTDISVDGGITWSECDVPLRLELSAPEIDVRLEPATELASGASTIDFGVLLSGGIAARNILIANHGNAVLSDFGLSLTGANQGDFIIKPPTFTTIDPGATVSIPVMLQATTAGTRTATLHIASNDSDENPFDIALTARVLSPTGDDDGDGLTNGQEMALQSNPLFTGGTSGGFNPLHSDSERLAALRDNGLYLATDMRGLALGRPVLQRNAATGKFVLRVGVLQSPDLSPPWTPLLGISPTYDPATGQIDIEFTPPADSPAHFYQVFGNEP